MISKPLAHCLRPISLDEVFGQEHLTTGNGFIKKCIENDSLFSIIFYGPPGVGKTTLALIIATTLKKQYRILNASTSNKKDMEIIVEEAKMYGHLIVIVDEVHRLNKDKQDYLLSYIEEGLITIIGTTTANPFHSINPAIRSRCHLLELKPLQEDDIVNVLKFALKSQRGLNGKYSCEDDVLKIIAKRSSGDVRFALNNLQICALTCENNIIDIEVVKNNLRVPNYMMDKDGDGHYDAVSALQKSIRGSDVDAALYYLAKLCLAEDLVSIERRLIITAYEDIGLGNPFAVDRTFNAIETAKRVGFPEAVIPLSLAVIDLSLSPKSRTANISINNAMKVAKEMPLDVPSYLKLTPTNLSEDEKYPYDRNDLWPKIQYLPEQLKNQKFFEYISNSKYEKALVENYLKTNKNKRTSDLVNLKKSC